MLKVDGKNAIEAITADGMGDIYSSDIEKVLSIQNIVLETVDENYTVVHSNSECSYINKEGQVVLNKEVFPKNSIYAFEENEKWGYKDKDDNLVIGPIYDFATDINKYGFGGIVLDGKWGIVNSKGEIIREPGITLDTYFLPMFVGEYLLEVSDTYHCLELE